MQFAGRAAVVAVNGISTETDAGLEKVPQGITLRYSGYLKKMFYCLCSESGLTGGQRHNISRRECAKEHIIVIILIFYTITFQPNSSNAASYRQHGIE